MPFHEAPCEELGRLPDQPNVVTSPSVSDVSTASSPEPTNVTTTPLFRVLAMPPPDPVQPPGQEDLERRLPGYRRIVIPRELTLIELLKECSGVTTDEEVLRIREARLRVVAERVGLRRLDVLAPRLKSLTLDGSALSSLRDLGIGLVHLKILSVKRCGLTSLDGVWGLSSLRELHAACNRLQDLHPLAALQKLHTLDLAENPISDATRLWTLGVCSSLRRLTLWGCPATNVPQYRTRVSSALPLLVYLDDRLLQENHDSSDEISDGSDSEESDDEVDVPFNKTFTPPEPVAGTSSDVNVVQNLDEKCSELQNILHENDEDFSEVLKRRRRPATTEAVGLRTKLELPPRPRTAHADITKTDNTTSRLEVFNTLLDDEWRCSGSKLTSGGAVCGNLAQALRRPSSVSHRCVVAEDEGNPKQKLNETIQDAARALAAEIPVLPSIEDWAKFRRETGIDIDLDFNERPKNADPNKVMEKLEMIEKETFERFRRDIFGNDDYDETISKEENYSNNNNTGRRRPINTVQSTNDILSLDFNAWRNIDNTTHEANENNIEFSFGSNNDFANNGGLSTSYNFG